MSSETQNLQYNHFIDLLSELILKYHRHFEKTAKEELTTENDSEKDSGE